MPSIVKRVLLSMFIIIVFLFNLPTYSHANGLPEAVKNGTVVGEEMVPMIEPGKEMMLMLNESRRKLGSFQICALCTCCGARGGYCLPTPCCYAISCNIPNRPFGFCSFLPKTCNCFGCHI
ncbi:unnamed protein product [Coffea canephora]|uniref:DUF7866 domain-containing protein n=2 Tax=Coffea TaxID=13442 RepID=A0A068U6W7_COFCA|nr:uncharacterized protein LOC113708754 [Coffea arabica]XP_027089368.1 uncharacterized protein LOC113710516 [Coffea arabica]XP_027184562.1 uncharacterized protein LOC113782831 [Coffea eugenioides]CDP04216.1 unnamed protein product [Coffea canephora]